MNVKGLISAITVIAAAVVSLASCGGKTTQQGTVNMNGSTSMQKMVEAECEVFNETYPNITASGQFTGSGAGLEAVAAGSADVGNASRALKDEEKAKGLVENIIALDGIAVVTNKNVAVDNLTTEQLAAIYTGAVSDWGAYGGESGQVVVIGREAGSGTRDAFEEILDIADKGAYAQELDSTGAVLTTVASTPNAIGYVSLDALDDSVNAVKINGVEATADNIKSGAYSLQRPFVMATRGEISEQSDAVKTWFNFLNSPEGQEVIANVGLISVK